jgi:transposase
MSASLLYHTQGITGFQHQSYRFENGKVIQRIKRKIFYCHECSSNNVSAFPYRVRHIQCNKIGNRCLYLEVKVHKIYCQACKTLVTEKLKFISHPKSRISSSLERSIIELRKEMSISAIAKFFNLDWRTVKECEKRFLKKKFKTIELKNVRIIAIDEIHVTRVRNKEKYLTVVRDIESGAVLHVGKGRGGESLAQFMKRLKHSKCKIKAVAIDMSKSYTAWIKKYLPDAEIVYDHFHVIKLINEKLDKVRRKTCASIDDEHKKFLKNQRFLFLRNIEDLEPDAVLLLNNLRKMFKDLGYMSMFKEALRSIYKEAETDIQAEFAFKNWILMARKTQIKELIDAANTIENNLYGITAYWRTDGLSNAYMEGFNNKIRWLIRQAYGFRDEEYFTLKIYNLPNTKIEAEL